MSQWQVIKICRKDSSTLMRISCARSESDIICRWTALAVNIFVLYTMATLRKCASAMVRVSAGFSLLITLSISVFFKRSTSSQSLLWKANIASYTFWSKKRKRSMVPNNANWKRNTKIHHIYSQDTIPTQYNLKPTNKIHTYALRSSSAGQLIGNCIPPPSARGAGAPLITEATYAVS